MASIFADKLRCGTRAVRGGRIVTDDLHYLGSLPTCAELRKRGTDDVDKLIDGLS